MKELERQCQKEKGITSMSVKDILQSLVDDGIVDTDKIGTSIYFWAFKSKATQNVSNSFKIQAPKYRLMKYNIHGSVNSYGKIMCYLFYLSIMLCCVTSIRTRNVYFQILKIYTKRRNYP